MEIGVSGPILTHKNTKGSIGKWYSYSTKWVKIMWQLFIFMELDPFPYYFGVTKTMNLSHKKWKLVYMDQYSHIKISKALWDNNTHTLHYGRKILWQLFIFMLLETFFYYFMITKTLNLSHKKYKLVKLDQCSHINKPKALWVNMVQLHQFIFLMTQVQCLGSHKIVEECL